MRCIKPLDATMHIVHNVHMTSDDMVMRLNLVLEPDDVESLAQVMAGMDPRGPDGKLRGIGLQDAVRHAIHETAKRGGVR
jgi:chemotaxis protein CheY-P-specific phosphatase CheC